MKISRKGKTGCALALAALMALAGVSAKQTYAAGGIDENVPRSITVSVAKGSNNSAQDKEFQRDLEAISIPVALYKVADVDKTGQNFTALKPFETMKFDINSETTASEWQEMALEAMKILGGAEENAFYQGEIAAGGSGIVTFDAPDTGMYLVVAGGRYNEEKTAKYSYNRDYTAKYTFTPYLTAMPGNQYASAYDEDGNPIHTDGNGGTLRDEWVYETTIGLKVEAEPLYGKVVIKKTLDNYNETLGKATFVYKVEGTDKEGNLYSEVVSTTHQDLTEQTVTLEGIPAGITVTVEEIYRGASYDISGDGMTVKQVKIWSDEAVQYAGGQIPEGGTEPIKTAEVSFQNKYNGGNRGGYGVVNEFANSDTGWTWERPEVPGLNEE